MVTRYLQYFKQVQNLFDLEFFFNKLPSRAHSAAGMEIAVLSGLPFWEDGEDALFNDDDDPYLGNDENNPQYSLADDGADGPYRNQLAEQVTQRLALDKKHKNQLINELDSMKDLFDALAKRMKAQELHLDISKATQFLQETIQTNFMNLVFVLGQIRDSHCFKHDAQKEIHAINSMFKLFSHQDDTKITYNNGFHVNHAATGTNRINLDECETKPDYTNFYKCTQGLLFEQVLAPTEFNLLQSLQTTQHV